MSVTFTYLVMNIVRTYAIYLFIDYFLRNKRCPSWFQLLSFGAYYVIATTLYLNQDTFNNSHNIIMNLSIVFYIGFLYRSTFQKKILCSVFIYLLSIVSDDCTGVILTIIFKVSLMELLEQNYLTLCGIIISTSLLLGIVILIKPLFIKHEAETNRLYGIAFFSIPSCSIYMLHSLIRLLEKGQSDVVFVFITIIILFAINILIFFLYSKLLTEEATRYENMMLTKQVDDYEKQASLIKNLQKDVNSQLHDLKNYLITIKELAELKKNSEIVKYIDDWLTNLVIIEPGIYTDNPIVNAMINSKLYLAGLQKTELDVNVNVPSELNTKDTDLTIILGNLLDNALEACSKLQQNKRWIQCDIYYSQSTLFVDVSNNCNTSELKMHDGTFYTTKNNIKAHGIGLIQVRQTVEKYHGIFECYIVEHGDNDIFNAKVMLYLSEKP